MAKGITHMPTVSGTKALGTEIKNMVLGFTNTKTKTFTKAIGSTIKGLVGANTSMYKKVNL